jgi:actin-like ATPase involved in cell morphogenesis
MTSSRKYSLGVDLGTTFVAAAVARESRVDMVALGDRSVVMPSVVGVRDDGRLVAGEPAARRVVSHPGQVASQIKRRLGDPTPLLLGGSAYPVTDLLGTLLRNVLDRVAEEEGGPPESLILTHPASWGPHRQKLFAEVPRFAAAANWRTVPEPVAAAAHYAATRSLAVGEVIAVYDLGGGTFDATVVSRTEHNIEVLGSPQGIERLGGVDLDEAILGFVNHATGGALTALDLRDRSTVIALARLRQDCVLAKEALSRDTEATIPVFLPGRHLEVELSRPQFENIIRPHVQSTIGALTRALQSAAITPDRLSTVLLVGGSSQIPMVAQMIEDQLGCRTAVDVHPQHAVALGAAALSRPAGAHSPIQPLPLDGAAVPGHPAPDLATDGAPAFRPPVPVVPTESASPGRRRRGAAVAVGLLLLAGAGSGLGVSLSQHGAQHQQATGTGAASAAQGTGTVSTDTVSTDVVTTEAATLPTDLPGLTNAVRADQTLAGAQTQPLVDQLVAVAASVGEARRQAALAALGISGGGGVQARLTVAVTAALGPLTALNTPADMIADLQPDPALGGPNATFVLECMREFSGHTPNQQQQEAQQILSDLPNWSANGGIRSDVADATVRIVTPVAQGQRSFTDVEASGPLPAPNGS